MPYPSKEQLNNKWWHRLLKVIFVISIIVIIITSIIASIEYSMEIDPKMDDIIVLNNLYGFTEKIDEKIVNTIPIFLESSGKLGCLDDTTGKIGYISESSLLRGICNSNLKNNLDSVVKKLKKNNITLSNELNKELLEGIINKDTTKRMCFISTDDVDCAHSKIIKYKIKPLVYLIECLKILGLSFIALLAWIIICLGAYKAFFYIVYGSNKK